MPHQAAHQSSCSEPKPARGSLAWCLGVVLAMLAWSGVASAQLEPQDEARFIDFGYNPVFAVEPGGAFGLVWEGRVRLSFPGTMFNEQGEPIDGRFRVRDEQPDREVEAGALAVDGSGHYLVAWTSNHISGADGRIRARFIDNQGQALSRQFELAGSQQSVHYQLHGAVANRSGDFVVLWFRFNSRGPTRLQAARFDSRLRPAGGTITVRTGREDPGFVVFGGDVAIDDAGRFVVTWQESNGDTERRFCFRRFDRRGRKLGGVRIVQRAPVMGFDPLTVAKEPTGEFAIVWGNEDRLRLRLYDPFGRSLANIVPVGRYESLREIGLARDRFGNTVVLWAVQETPLQKIFARVYDRLGNALGEPVEVGAGFSFSAQFADDGTLTVSWVAFNGPHFILAYRRFEMTCGPGYEQRCDP